jgi:D-beta-D-heptose 7-phosphate kinase/D-beta-D-heptose 1-phosphate adenosyltransferase
MSTRLIELMENLPRRRVVLIGDLMVDRYLYGNAGRLSPEAPVPVLHYQREDSRLGGAGRVAADLAMLGAEVHLVSVVGDDDTGKQIRQMLLTCGVNVDGLIQIPGRPSTSKVRLVGLAQHRHPQQMMRLDYEDPSPIPAVVARDVLAKLDQAMQGGQGGQGAAAICIEDYDKGLLSPEVCKQVIATARKRGVPSFVDPAAIADYSKYSGASAITPNRTEAELASGRACGNPEEYQQTAQWLLDHLQLEAAIITLDKNGVYLAGRDGERRWIKTRERKVYDVAGAGDMVLAMLAVARSAGASWEESATLGNIAGGLEVEKFGSVPITKTEIIHELLGEIRQHAGKRRTLDRLLPELAIHRAAGKRIVFTNGCFDLIHPGHIKSFQLAKREGEVLVVGVNTDAGIRRLKGEKRPLISELDRVSVLEELESIDYLVTFDEDIPIKLIEAIRPDVLVKGADYAKQQLEGWEFVESYGGRVVLVPLVEGKSTSAVIERILLAHRSTGVPPVS